MARTGRRPGPSDTHGDILRAAAGAFSAGGYERATVRGIAAAAGVDAALIRRFFGSKDGLFTAVAAAAIRPGDALDAVLDGPAERVGERLARYYLTLLGEPDRPGPALGLIRAAVSSEHAAGLMREFLADRLLGRIAATLRGDRPELRAALAASQLVGIAVTRYAVRLAPLAAAPTGEVASWLAPVLQHHLTGPLGGPTATSAREGEGS
jgi:AcrR family transcriptional regulator